MFWEGLNALGIYVVTCTDHIPHFARLLEAYLACGDDGKLHDDDSEEEG